MKQLKHFLEKGYQVYAYSSNGAFEVTSYLARNKYGRKVHGFYSHKAERYVENFL